ncbi:MAG: cardiolipin synthase, partial [Clostridia bacterium]|nr:cardiolipin synthase [Clostridia bacterium]
EGDGVIGFTLMFLQMWNLNEADESYGKYLTSYYSVPSDGYVIPYNDSPLDNDLVGENVYLDMINTAKDYVHITTPYLILDNEMISALTFAAKRGIDVTIIMPHIPDKKLIFDLSRSYYKRLLESGVKIYEYTPGFVHAKMFVSDGIKATVGTINLDFRSLYHHFECGVYMYGTGAEREIEKDFYDTLKKCEKITLSGLKKDKLIGKLVGKVLKLVAPLL